MNLLFLHPGPQVSFRLCPVPPKFERCQAVNVLITRMVDLPHKRSFVCICNQLLDSNKIKTNFIICVIQVGHPRDPRGPGAGGAGVPPEPRGHLGAAALHTKLTHRTVLLFAASVSEQQYMFPSQTAAAPSPGAAARESAGIQGTTKQGMQCNFGQSTI